MYRHTMESYECVEIYSGEPQECVDIAESREWA